MMGTQTNWLIRSLYHENGDMLVWWRPNGAGYTTILDNAGRYTEEEAKARCAGARRNVPVREEDALAASVRVVLAP